MFLIFKRFESSINFCFYPKFCDCCSLGGEDLAGEQVEDGVDAEGVGDEHHDGDEQGHQAEDVVYLSLSLDCASWRPPQCFHYHHQLMEGWR